MAEFWNVDQPTLFSGGLYMIKSAWPEKQPSPQETYDFLGWTNAPPLVYLHATRYGIS